MRAQTTEENPQPDFPTSAQDLLRDRFVLAPRFELVTHPVARLEECMNRRATVDLVAKLAHEHVHGSVPVAFAPAPQFLEQFVPADDATLLQREGVEETELGRCQTGTLAVDVRLYLAGVDSKLLDLDRLAAAFLLASGAAPRGGGDSGDKLLHGERLDEIVVGADLEGMDTVVLRPSCADHDDRRSDAFRSRLLDQAPAVHTGQHQIDDTDLGVLESEARQAGLPVAHRDRVETGAREVARHALCNDLVVFDDE